MYQEFFSFIFNFLDELYNSYNENNLENNSIDDPLNNMDSSLPSDSDSDSDSDSSKKKKILKILLFLILFFLGSAFVYYLYIIYTPSAPEPFTIESALKQLELLLPAENYKNLSETILGMEKHTGDLKRGIMLLNVVKNITILSEDVQENQKKNFEEIMNNIIKYFEGDND